MSFIVPPLPGERLLIPKEVVCPADRHVTTVHKFTNDGKLDRQLIAESEAERFIREWPSRNRGVSARWREYRAWKASRCTANPAGAPK